MATMKFTQMATKKLQKLVNDPATSEEDKVAIQAIIDKRQAVAKTEEQAQNDALSPEEQAAINAAEKEAAKQNAESPETKEAKIKAKREVSPKQTMEQLDAECAEAEANAKGHRCETVVPGTAIKIGGYVKSVLKEKRAMRCYLLIQPDITEDNPTGKQFYKVFKDVTILPETVELHKAKKTSTRRKAQVDTEEWAAQADEIINAAGEYVGRPVDLGDENKTNARIETVIKDKRSCTVFFRIGFTDENGAHKFTHKAVHTTTDEAEVVRLLSLSQKVFWRPMRITLSTKINGRHAPSVSHEQLLLLRKRYFMLKRLSRKQRKLSRKLRKHFRTSNSNMTMLRRLLTISIRSRKLKLKLKHLHQQRLTLKKLTTLCKCCYI